MPEIAYDLYSGTYVEGNWTEEEEAEKQRLEEARRLRSRVSYDYGFDSMVMHSMMSEFYKAMEKATLDMMIYGSSPVVIIHDSIYFVDEGPAGRFSSSRPIEWSSKPIYLEAPREKFRDRALQANQPGDQPWKKRK